MTIFLLVFTESGEKRKVKYLIESESQADQLLRDIRDIYALNPEQRVFITYSKAQDPDPHLDKSDGNMYCPYCARYRFFYRYYNYLRCPVCNISDAHFHVRRYNGMQ